MDFNIDLLAYCGIYCDQCMCRVAVAEQDFRHLETMPAKHREGKTELSDYYCGGCKGSCLCDPCVLKECAKVKNIDHCGECSEFPCAKLSSFANDGAPHHFAAMENLLYIRENGISAWFDKFQSDLQCQCGKRKSWYCGCPEHG